MAALASSGALMGRTVIRRIIEKLGGGGRAWSTRPRTSASTAWSFSNSCLRTWPENTKLGFDSGLLSILSRPNPREVVMSNKLHSSVCGLFTSILMTALLWFPATPELVAQSSHQYALLRKPTVSKTQIAFSYGGDLWVVDRGGGEAKRLTSDVGIEIDPVFSPDGTTIAFTGEYDGNEDV